MYGDGRIRGLGVFRLFTDRPIHNLTVSPFDRFAGLLDSLRRVAVKGLAGRPRRLRLDPLDQKHDFAQTHDSDDALARFRRLVSANIF